MIEGEDRYARLAAQLLRGQAAQTEFRATEGRRDTVVAAMALAVAEKRRRRRAVVAVGVALAAAAGVLLMVRATPGHKSAAAPADTTLLVEEHTGAGNTLVRNALQEPLLDGVHLVEGDAIQSQEGSSTTLAFANGTRVTLSEAGRLQVDELAATRRFSLRAGHLQAHVAKLARGERFVVDTPDAEVEVRGTVFEVAVTSATGCGDRARSSTVEVKEGSVWVRSGTREVLLRPGASWTSPCASAAAELEAAPTSEGTKAVDKRPGPHPAHRPVAVRRPAVQGPTPTIAPAPVAPPPVAATIAPQRESHLAEQNNLLSAAMAAEHAGDHATAIGKLDQLIQRFPAGPLLESARAEKQRILSAQSRP